MTRRIVALWLPRMGAERASRGRALEVPFATVAPERGALRLASLCARAEEAGLSRGMGLADARALRPDLATRPAEPEREAAFLSALARWARRFSPWVAEDGAEGLALDVTGCAHLFGGEAAMLEDMVARLARAGLTARAACADTRGGAWALARFAAGAASRGPVGDAVAAEAPATRVRSPARAARPAPPPPSGVVVAAPGRVRAAVAPLPVAALRIEAAAAEGLARLGLRTIGDLALLPRGAVARRFGVQVVRRLDQALGAEPEPVAAGRPAASWAVRFSSPEPLGRVEDVAAGLERLLARLCATLAAQEMGARRLRLSLRRVDRADAHVEIGLARPSRDAAQIAELFARPLGEVDAGFGIDALRLEALEVEPLGARQTRGPLDPRDRDDGEALATLMSRLGGRLGFEAVTRFLPADSHIPARAFTVAAAGWSEPHAGAWPAPPGPRPLTLWRPEPVIPEPAIPELAAAEGAAAPPRAFRWRGRRHAVAAAFGPERIAPEWWLDDPDWRTGPRDYWRIETATGERLWLFHAPRSSRLDRWFAEGAFG